eukprot:4947735-Prymnesium_polylepis.1
MMAVPPMPEAVSRCSRAPLKASVTTGRRSRLRTGQKSRATRWRQRPWDSAKLVAPGARCQRALAWRRGCRRPAAPCGAEEGPHGSSDGQTAPKVADGAKRLPE